MPESATRMSCILGFVGICAAAPTQADTIALTCAANAMFNAPEMTIVYEGEAEGTLTITAPFGAIVLPAARESRGGADETGQPLSATGILASGPATVQMPDKSAIEACVRGRLPSDQLADADIVFVTVMGCANEAPVATEPVAIQASAEIALSPMVYVGVTRTYAEPTDLVIGTIALEAYPSCEVAQ